MICIKSVDERAITLFQRDYKPDDYAHNPAYLELALKSLTRPYRSLIYTISGTDSTLNLVSQYSAEAFCDLRAANPKKFVMILRTELVIF